MRLLWNCRTCEEKCNTLVAVSLRRTWGFARPAFCQNVRLTTKLIGWKVDIKRSDEVRASARYVPADRLLVETDSPYLAPEPLRGRRCEPAFVVYTARRIAEERGVPFEALAAFTTANALAMFG